MVCVCVSFDLNEVIVRHRNVCAKIADFGRDPNLRLASGPCGSEENSKFKIERKGKSNLENIENH